MKTGAAAGDVTVLQTAAKELAGTNEGLTVRMQVTRLVQQVSSIESVVRNKTEALLVTLAAARAASPRRYAYALCQTVETLVAQGEGRVATHIESAFAFGAVAAGISRVVGRDAWQLMQDAFRRCVPQTAPPAQGAWDSHAQTLAQKADDRCFARVAGLTALLAAIMQTDHHLNRGMVDGMGLEGAWLVGSDLQFAAVAPDGDMSACVSIDSRLRNKQALPSADAKSYDADLVLRRTPAALARCCCTRQQGQTRTTPRGLFCSRSIFRSARPRFSTNYRRGRSAAPGASRRRTKRIMTHEQPATAPAAILAVRAGVLDHDGYA